MRCTTLLSALLSTLGLTLGAWLAQAGPAAAQAAAPLSPAEQAITDRVYQSCLQDGKLGAIGGELEANCQCEAEATLSILTDAGRQALANGTYGKSYSGPLFTVDQEGYSRVVIKSCPGVRPVLVRQICDPAPASAACAKLKQALQGAQ
jgi:hypothetical protein